MRLPFDPGRAAGAPATGAPAAGRAHTVSEVAGMIQRALEERTPAALRVIGQVGNLRAQGHWYFSLRDERAVLSCVAWATAARTFGFEPAEGDEVVATGELGHYGPQGRTQLYVSALARVGAGALELRFRALCDTLRREGYFDEARKRALPVFPRRIAVITSRAGAALHDVLVTAAQRCPAVGLVVVDVRVQGEGAAPGIARAIRWVDASRDALGVDAILVTRGGGSAEDLWPFNERVVADATLRSTLPVVAAIGHESDTTIIELVADQRASTPTQAVMKLVPDRRELGGQVAHLSDRLDAALRRLVDGRRQRLERAGERLTSGLRRQVDRRGLLDASGGRLRRAMVARVERLAERAAALGRQLDGVDPARVLARGFSMTATAEGRIVRSVSDVSPGSAIVTRVADGEFPSVVRDRKKGMDLFGASQ